MTEKPWWLDLEYKDAITNRQTSQAEWDSLFIDIAERISKMSKCFSRKVGAIIVKDKQILSIGYNGSPAGSTLCQGADYCPRKKMGCKSGECIELCPAQHAEENAIHNAAKNGISTAGSTLYAYCFTKDARIVTKTGFKYIKDIIPGELVLSSDGKFHKVIGTTIRNYSGKIVNIEPKGLKGFSLPATSDHIIFAKKSNICKRESQKNRNCFLCSVSCKDAIRNTKYEEIKATDLNINDLLYIPKIEKLYKSNWYNYAYTKLQQDMFKDPDFPWIIGMYIAEGSIQTTSQKRKENKVTYISGVSFALHQEEILYQNKIIDFFSRYGISTNLQKSKTSKSCYIQVSSSQLGKYFKEMCGSGCQNKKIPETLLFSEDILQIISGIFDGDGCIIKDQKTIKTCSTTLKDQIAYVLLFLGYNVKYSEDPERLDKNNIYHRTSWAISYKDVTTNCQNRKDNYIKIGQIVRTEVSNEDVYDLMVEENPSYTVGITSVHNCGMPCQRCAGALINAGIKEVVCLDPEDRYDRMAKTLFLQARVTVRSPYYKDKPCKRIELSPRFKCSEVDKLLYPPRLEETSKLFNMFSDRPFYKKPIF